MKSSKDQELVKLLGDIKYQLQKTYFLQTNSSKWFRFDDGENVDSYL